jgi:hypothetical protein
MKTVIDTRIQKGSVTVDGIPAKITLPEGCVGICFVFESKKAAYNFGSRESDLMEIKLTKIGKNSVPQ